MNGFALVASLLSQDQVTDLISSLEGLDQSESVRARGGVFAVRNLLDVSEPVRLLASSWMVQEIVAPVLGLEAFPVRGILFDKTPGANWKVPWHQDVTIAVSSRVEAAGFGSWSIKAGVLHVQPPAEVLENMLTVRIHLDPCTAENGALKVIAGSHSKGKLSEVEASQIGMKSKPTICELDAGGALLMRPLLLHASSSSNSPKHRRVIHLDYSAKKLHGGLQWAAEKRSGQ